MTHNDEKSGEGLVRHVLCRKGFRSGQHMVCLVINGTSLPHQEALVEKLCGHVDSLSFSVNMENTNVIMGTKIVHLYGPGYIEDSIGEVCFRISPLSFYQVNPVQTEEMYGAALEFADLQGTENVWDLYCGIGTISLFKPEGEAGLWRRDHPGGHRGRPPERGAERHHKRRVLCRCGRRSPPGLV